MGKGRMTYQERMRALREDNDLTQTEVGKIINKSQQGYNHIETGRAELKIEDLIKLCDFYKVSADYFIGRKNNQHPNPFEDRVLVFYSELNHKSQIVFKALQ